MRLVAEDEQNSLCRCRTRARHIARRRQDLALANLPDSTDNDRLEFLSLREYTPKERIEIIECALATTEGIGLVIIDGVRDLLFDINAPLEATQITSILMRWTDEYQIHTSHGLPSEQNDRECQRSIGTEINNKAETIIKGKDSAREYQQGVHVFTCTDFPTAHSVSAAHSSPNLLRDYVSERRNRSSTKKV